MNTFTSSPPCLHHQSNNNHPFPSTFKPPLLQSPTSNSITTITMSSRSLNRKPLQKGRISIEAIQTVQSLKRAKGDSNLLSRVFEMKVRRLVKLDMVAVLRELQRQNEPLLALQVFEDMRKEYWYKPQVQVFADMIKTLASNNLFEEVELLFLYMKEKHLDPKIEGFNALFKTLMEYDLNRQAMECFHMMKEVECDPDRSTFRILINGLESKGETGLSSVLRQEAENYFGSPLEFLEVEEPVSHKSHHWKNYEVT